MPLTFITTQYEEKVGRNEEHCSGYSVWENKRAHDSQTYTVPLLPSRNYVNFLTRFAMTPLCWPL